LYGGYPYPLYLYCDYIPRDILTDHVAVITLLKVSLWEGVHATIKAWDLKAPDRWKNIPQVYNKKAGK
jgi:hypothetical protein